MLDSLKNAIAKTTNQNIPEQKDNTYQRKLDTFTKNAEHIYKTYGQTEYNRYLKYYTTKANVEKYGIDQNAISPSYAKLDDLIDNRQQYESKYGKKGYNTLYSATYNLMKDEVNTLNDAVSLKEKGAYSYNVLPESWKSNYTYTNDAEDTLRQKLGLVPKAFESKAKAIVDEAKMIATPDKAVQETENSLKETVTAYKDKFKTTEDKPINEKELSWALRILDYQDTNGTVPAYYGGTPLKDDYVGETTTPQVKTREQQTAEKSTNNAYQQLLNTNTGDIQSQIDALETQNKALDKEIMRANREVYATGDNEFLKLNSQRSENNKKLLELRQTFKSAGYAQKIDKYNKLAENSDFNDYVKQGAEKGGFLDNIKNLIGNEDLKEKFSYITDNEKNVYYYLLGKQGEETSKKYLKDLMESLNYRQGSAMADNTDGFLGTAGMAVKSGLDNFAQGAAQLLFKDALPTSATQYASSQVRENLDGIGGIAYDATQAVTNMVPSILFSSLVTAASGGLGAAPALASTLGSAAGSTLMGATSGAMAYNEALKQGYTEEQALNYGVLTGATEGGLQYLLGGVTKLGGKLTGKLASNAIAKIDNTLLRVAAKVGTNALSEGTEEYLQEVISPVIKNVTLDEKNEFKPFSEQALYNGILGAITGGLFSVGDIKSTIKAENTQNTTQNAEQITPIAETAPITEQQPAKVEIPQAEQATKSIPTLKEALSSKTTNGTKTSQVATSSYDYTADETLKKNIDAGLYDFIPKSAAETYNRKSEEVEKTGVQSTITKFENPVETINGKTKTKRYNDEDVSEVIAALVKAQKDGDVKAQQELMAIAVDMGTTSGRQTNMFKMLRNLDSTGQIYALNRELKRINAEGRKIYGAKWTDLSLTEMEIDSIQKGINDKDWTTAKKKIYDRLNESMPSTFTEKDAAFRRIAMLLNPKTHVRNMVGNTAMMALVEVRDKAMAIIQKALPKDQRIKALKISNESKQIAKNYFDEAGVAAHLEQGHKYETGRFKLQSGQKRTFKSNIGNKIDKFSMNTLSLEDALFKKHRYLRSLSNYIEAQGLTEVTSEAHEYAIQDALEATFQDKNEIAAWLQNLKKTKGGAVADIAMPFVQTPVNIARRTAEYSPFGLGMAGYDFINVHKENKNIEAYTAKLNENISAKERTDIEYRIEESKENIKKYAQKGIKNLAQGITGTALMTLGFVLASGNLIPGIEISADTPDSDKEEEYLKANGWQPLALKVGDTYISLDWATPVSPVILAGASVYHETEKSLGSALTNLPLNALSTMADAITNSSVFTSIRNLIKQNRAGDIITELLTSYGSQHIPTIGIALNNIVESDKVSYYNNDKISSLKNKAIMSVPGLRKVLESAGLSKALDLPTASTDAWGNNTSAGSLLSRTIGNLINPATVTHESKDAINTEIERLYKSTGNTKVFPQILQKNMSTKDVKEILGINSISMTNYEKSTIQQELNKSYYRVVSAYINSSAYNVPDEDKTLDETRASKLNTIYDKMLSAYKTRFLKSKIPTVPKIK